MSTISWLENHVNQHLEYMKGHGEKNPFDIPHDTENYLCFQENDYLRLSKDPRVRNAQVAAAMNLQLGKLSATSFMGAEGENQKLCRLLAESMKCGGVLLTTAGWPANVGLIEAITPRGMPVYVDAKAHASLWDGARLASENVVPFAHNNVHALAKRVNRHGPGVVIVDAFYSTDGSVADLRTFAGACESLECVLVVDEAHSFGIVGDKGGGLAVEAGVQDKVHYRTGSFSKALGGYGGFIAGKEDYMTQLRFRCHSLVFSSSMSEVVGAGNRAALEIVMADPSRGRQCLDMAAVLRRELLRRGINTGASACQIVSILLYGQYTASKLHCAMREKGILASVFAPPATPRSRSLLRFSIHALTNEDEMVHTAQTAADCIDALGIRDRLIDNHSAACSQDLANPCVNMLELREAVR